MSKYFVKLLLAFLFISCGRAPHVNQESVVELATLLQSLDRRTSYAEESLLLAKEIFRETEKLRQKFKPVSEPHVNNLLINIGIKEEGLCYQWSDALYRHFIQRAYPHYAFHLLVADKGKYLFEHNVMVVTAKQKGVNEKMISGVIIDPWREPGKLYFSKVEEDSGYRWKWRREREIGSVK